MLSWGVSQPARPLSLTLYPFLAKTLPGGFYLPLQLESLRICTLFLGTGCLLACPVHSLQALRFLYAEDAADVCPRELAEPGKSFSPLNCKRFPRRPSCLSGYT